LSHIGRRFALSDRHGHGVSCGEKGVFVGAVPLIEPCHGCAGLKKFRPRPLADLNRDLSTYYGLPIDFSAKAASLESIAQALSRGDIIHAQIVTLHLRIPDPPPLVKGSQTATEVVALAKDLRASGLLKADWDPAKHPRWPAGSPGGVGGEFAPDGAVTDAPMSGERHAAATPAQLAIPAPFDFTLPRTVPMPSEVVPPLSVSPRHRLENPYPDREGCDEEWAHAKEYCRELADRGQLGKGDYREHGKVFLQCVLGQVSERCGGSPTA
jgi:hypothetical protein